jgi:hypothetical protein
VPGNTCVQFVSAHIAVTSFQPVLHCLLTAPAHLAAVTADQAAATPVERVPVYAAEHASGKAEPENTAEFLAGALENAAAHCAGMGSSATAPDGGQDAADQGACAPADALTQSKFTHASAASQAAIHGALVSNSAARACEAHIGGLCATGQGAVLLENSGKQVAVTSACATEGAVTAPVDAACRTVVAHAVASDSGAVLDSTHCGAGSYATSGHNAAAEPEGRSASAADVLVVNSGACMPRKSNSLIASGNAAGTPTNLTTRNAVDKAPDTPSTCIKRPPSHTAEECVPPATTTARDAVSDGSCGGLMAHKHAIADSPVAPYASSVSLKPAPDVATSAHGTTAASTDATACSGHWGCAGSQHSKHSLHGSEDALLVEALPACTPIRRPHAAKTICSSKTDEVPLNIETSHPGSHETQNLLADSRKLSMVTSPEPSAAELQSTTCVAGCDNGVCVGHGADGAAHSIPVQTAAGCTGMPSAHMIDSSVNPHAIQTPALSAHSGHAGKVQRDPGQEGAVRLPQECHSWDPGCKPVAGKLQLTEDKLAASYSGQNQGESTEAGRSASIGLANISVLGTGGMSDGSVRALLACQAARASVVVRAAEAVPLVFKELGSSEAALSKLTCAESSPGGFVVRARDACDKHGDTAAEDKMQPFSSAASSAGTTSSAPGWPCAQDSATTCTNAATGQTPNTVGLWCAQGGAPSTAGHVPAVSKDNSDEFLSAPQPTACLTDVVREPLTLPRTRHDDNDATEPSKDASRQVALKDILEDLPAPTPNAETPHHCMMATLAPTMPPECPISSALQNALKSLTNNEPDDEPLHPRSVNSSRVAAFSRGGRSREAISDDDAGRLCLLMDTESPATVSEPGHTTPTSPYGGFTISPAPYLSWKAGVLRVLRGAPDHAITITALAALMPNPTPGTSYAAQVQTHLVDRLLAKWVVENESLMLYCA